MRGKITQLLALAGLVAIFFLSLLPVYAQQGTQGDEPEVTPTPNPELKIPEVQPKGLTSNSQEFVERQAGEPTEIPELRTASSKHFRLGPNLHQAEISAIPLHYRDRNGEWQEIDTRPVPRPEGGFRVEANDVRLVFPENLEQTGLEVEATVYPTRHEERAPAELRERAKPDPAELAGLTTAKIEEQALAAAELSLAWQPLSLVYAGDSGPVATAHSVLEAAGGTVDNGVEYQAFDNATLLYRSLPVGFSQQLRLNGLPAGAISALAAGATSLEFAVQVELPPGVQIFADGVLQTEAFVTNRLELRDQAGNGLLIVAAPQLRDQTVSRISAPAQYRVEPTADGMQLITELPLDWLIDTEREFPVLVESAIIFPTDLTSNLFTSSFDTWIWECLFSALNSSIMWIGNFPSGCSPGAERALVYWVVSSLPEDAMIGRPGVEGPTESRLWRLPGSDTGAAGTIPIGTHRMFSFWDLDATWLARTSSDAWNQPGASDDFEISPEDTVNVSTADPTGYRTMGSLASAVGAWHSWDYFFPWGGSNEGVIYKSTVESGPANDRAFAQFGFTGAISAPQLSVTYFTDTLFVLTPNTNFFLPRSPSPDYFRIDGTAAWRAIGIRAPDGRSDYDLFLSPTSDNNFGNTIASSLEVGNTPDFIVIRPDASETLFPWSAPWTGTGLYYLRYPVQSEELMIGGNTLINDMALSFTVLSIYRVNMTAGESYEIRTDIVDGNLDLGMALFTPAAAGGSDYMARDEAEALADDNSFGGSEVINYSPSVSGWYGLVVWNNGGTEASNFNVSLAPQAAAGSLIYLPLALKTTSPPLTNGSFESGTSPWLVSGPGHPMVGSAVSNPASGCFSGNSTAQLGTPGQFPNNTIPTGEVVFQQAFGVPSSASQLTFNYQVYSYDIIQGASSGRFYDRFEVEINGIPVLTDGNPAGSTNGTTLWQSGCKQGTIDISAYAGQNINLKIAVIAENATSFNTWAHVDNVAVQ